MTVHSRPQQSSSSPMKFVAIAAGAAVAGAAIYYFVFRKSAKDTDADADAAFSKPAANKASSSSVTNSSSSNAAAAAATSSTSSSASNAGLPRSGSSGGDLVAEPSMFGGNSSFSGDAMFRDNTDGVVMPGVPDENGNVQFPHLRCMLKLEPKWSISEEVSPVPSMAMVQLQHDSFRDMDPQTMQAPPGEIPLIMLSVEDVTMEGSTLEEAKEKAKRIGMGQLNMMTNQMFPPQLTKDATADVGHFRYIIEIMQRSPYFELHVINYFAMMNNVVYNFQMMAKPELVSKLRHDFATMVRNLRLIANPADDDFEQNSFVCVPLKNGAGQVRLPVSWNVSGKTEGGGGDAAKPAASVVPEDSILASVQTPSMTRPETVVITNKAPTTDGGAAAAALTKIKEGTEGDGVAFAEYKTTATKSESARHYKVFKNPSSDLWLVSGPTTVHNQVTSNALFAQIAKAISTTKSTDSSNNSTVYESPKFGFSFTIRKGGRVMESRIGEKVVMYGPLGGMDMPQGGMPPTEEQMQAAQEQPIVTIRIGDPETDPDCKETLDEWKQNVQKQTEGNLQNIRKEKIGGSEFLTFESKDMVEVGEGRKEERMAKMYVVICGRRSTMVRWESPTGVWRKYENMMNEMISSLKVF